MKLIRDLLTAGTATHGETIKDFQRRRPAEYKTLVSRIAREAFDDVIPRFHSVHGSPITPAIFEFTGVQAELATPFN